MTTPRAILIGCGATKLTHAAPAAELYVGNLFRQRRAYAERSGAPWAILSAQWGLVRPERVLEPYDVSMASKKPADLHRWGSITLTALYRWLVDVDLATFVPPTEPAAGYTRIAYAKGLSIELHAGAAYTAPLITQDTSAERHDAVLWRTPLAGLGIGKQLAWYRTKRMGEQLMFEDATSAPDRETKRSLPAQ